MALALMGHSDIRCGMLMRGRRTEFLMQMSDTK
jgi:hypothetical protein